MDAEMLPFMQVLNARIVYRRDLAPGLAIVRIAPDEGEAPPFIAGQYCTLGLPVLDERGRPAVRHGKVQLVRRAYSIASSANERRYLELYLVLVPQGKLSPRVFAMELGEELYLDPRANGTFTLETVAPDKDLVMVATGTGVAPFVSMLRTYRERREKRWRRFVLIHGVRYAQDLGYHDELGTIAAEDAGVRYLPTVTREPQASAWQGLRGRVQQVLPESAYQQLVGSPLAAQTCHVFLCGNPQMIQSVRTMLEARGFTPHTRKQQGNLHFERYW